MSRFVFAFLAILAIVAASASASRPRCPKNEVWMECGTACPPTCKVPKPEICTLQCVEGCQCVKGLLRNKQGKCVEPCDC